MSDQKTYTIMVLDDGETYSEIDGCSSYVVSEKVLDRLADGEKLSMLMQLRPMDIKVITTYEKSSTGTFIHVGSPDLGGK